MPNIIRTITDVAPCDCGHTEVAITMNRTDIPVLHVSYHLARCTECNKVRSKSLRIGDWAGRPEGTLVREADCIAQIRLRYRGIIGEQCSHKRGKGRDGLFCGIHAKKDSGRPTQ